jgi:hypothetical protein
VQQSVARSTSEESRVAPDDGNSCVAQVRPQHIRVMGSGILPSGEKVLRILVFNADIFGAYSAQPGSLGLGRSLPVAIMADSVPGCLVLAMLPRQRLQRGIGGEGRKAAARPVGIDQGQGLWAEIDIRGRLLRRALATRNQDGERRNYP